MLSFGGCLSAIGQTRGFGEFICSTTRLNWHAADFPSCKMMRWSVISVLGDLSRSNDTAKPGILPPRLQSGAPNPWDDLAVSRTISCMPQTAGSNPPPAARALRKRGHPGAAPSPLPVHRPHFAFQVAFPTPWSRTTKGGRHLGSGMPREGSQPACPRRASPDTKPCTHILASVQPSPISLWHPCHRDQGLSWRGESFSTG